jgi:uncharacterized protein YjbI with pentapeptide repeats
MSDDGIQLQLRGATFKADLIQIVGSVIKGIGATVLAIKTGGVSLGLMPNAISTFFGVLKGFTRAETSELKAWMLVSGALLFAVEKVVSDLSLNMDLPSNALDQFADDLGIRVATRTYTIEPGFFLSPNNLPLLDDAAHELASWLGAHGIPETPKVTRSRLERYFPIGLHRTWMKDPSRFDALEQALESPFAATLKELQEREGYLQYVEEEFTQIRLIGQEEDDPNAVRLAQVFIPLRAYIEQERSSDTGAEPSDQQHEMLASPDPQEVQQTKLVVDLFDALDDWILSPKSRDWMRLISGGPGIGKSSSMRAFVARLARNGRAYPIHVPLQKLDRPMEPLRARVAHYLTTTKTIPFSRSPLDTDERLGAATPILLVFDGLDELVRPGKDADEIARDFMNDLQRLLEDENGHRGKSSPRVLALVSGRIGAARSAARALKCSADQVLFLIPFAVSGASQFVDAKALLSQDQRRSWWELWSKASKDVPAKIPDVLMSRDLFDVTVEPLLLYFVAFVRPWDTFGQDGAVDRNWLYDRLLRDFYSRECNKGDRNLATEFETFEAYETVLQAMALAAWYDGSTRIGTIDVVKKLLHDWDDEIEAAFMRIVGSNRPAVGAALAFYMRPGESPNSFEFLHKTFAEYLVARRLVDAVRSIEEAYRASRSAHGSRRRQYDETAQLQNWLRLTGPQAMDFDVLTFLRDEMSRSYRTDSKTVAGWRNALAHLMRICLRDRMPAHSLSQLPDERLILRPQNFFETVEQERNAELCLLACLNSTILPEIDDSVFKPIDIRPENSNHMAMGQLLARVRGQRVGPRNLGVLLFAGLDMSFEIFHIQDAYGMDARRADLAGSEWTLAVLNSSNLSGANAKGAEFWHADLSGATLLGANFEDARLEGVRMKNSGLVGANLLRAHLKDADLSGSNLQEAILISAVLSKASLIDADLRGADLSRANFTGANMTKVKLKGAKLSKAKMKSVVHDAIAGSDATSPPESVLGAQGRSKRSRVAQRRPIISERSE